MSDRELLEMAALAAGIQIATWSNAQAGGFQTQESASGRFWNPLNDNADALRLAMSLELGVVCKRESDPHEKNRSVVTDPYRVGQLRIVEPHNCDPEAATRRAIVRAAAEIGRTIK